MNNKENCCQPPHPLIRDGASQKQRGLPMLDPKSVEIDDRSFQDLMIWARNYAKELAFYDKENRLTGDWQQLIDNDPAMLIALISLYDTRKLRNTFDTQLNLVKNETVITKKIKAFKALSQQLISLAVLVDEWFGKSNLELSLYRILKQIIASDIAPAIIRLKSYDMGSKDSFGSALELDYSELEKNNILWEIDKAVKKTEIYKGFTDLEKLDNATDSISNLFSVIYRVIVRFVNDAPSLTDEVLTWSKHEPHMALLIAFFKMFNLLQKDMNQLTTRHLDYYYKEVLQLGLKSEVADKAHLIFTLSPKHISAFNLKQDVEFKAGKDIDGINIHYRTLKDVALNQAKIKELKAIYIDRSDGNDIYESPIVNSIDGKGGDFEDPATARWKTFSQVMGRDKAKTGFVIASPTLLLAQGSRKITLEITFEDSDIVKDVENLFDISLSTAEEWLNVTALTKVTIDKKIITMVINLANDNLPITAFNSEVEFNNYNTAFPLLKIETTDTGIYHDILSTSKISNIDISVSVTDMRNLILANDQGPLSTNKPIAVFGNTPKKEARFLIGCQEAMQKNLSKIEVVFDWQDVPNLEAYYAGYYQFQSTDKSDEHNGITNDKVKCSVSFLNKSEASGWKDFGTEHQLLKLASNNYKIVQSINGNSWSRLTGEKIFSSYNNDLKRGFISLTLNTDFKHSDFPNIYAKVAIKLVQDEKSTLILPNPPYIPIAKSVSLNYDASDKNILSNLGQKNAVEQVFHLYPFGYKEILDSSTTLLPAFEHEVINQEENEQKNEYETTAGELFIGLKNTPKDGNIYNLSILFQVSEGTADPSVETPPDIIWSYLSGNEWMLFDAEEILEDDTTKLVRSGIITFVMPKNINNNHTILSNNNVWIRASVAKNPQAICDLVSVQAQAVKVEFIDNNNISHLEQALPAETISKMTNKDSAISEFIQPYASFGGKAKEQSANYYLRVSERLRHKDRSITIWDYENLILEAMPNIYKVKCLSHTAKNYDLSGNVKDFELYGGHISIVIIPKVIHKTGIDLREPFASQSVKTEVEEFITSRSPRAIKNNIRILNPIYEQISTDFKVIIEPGYDEGLSIELLKKDIVHYLSPWAFESGVDISFGGSIHSSSIVDFINERPYVDTVHDFKMFLDGKKVIEAITHTARSILVAAKEKDHKIKGVKHVCTS